MPKPGHGSLRLRLQAFTLAIINNTFGSSTTRRQQYNVAGLGGHAGATSDEELGPLASFAGR